MPEVRRRVVRAERRGRERPVRERVGERVARKWALRRASRAGIVVCFGWFGGWAVGVGLVRVWRRDARIWILEVVSQYCSLLSLYIILMSSFFFDLFSFLFFFFFM